MIAVLTVLCLLCASVAALAEAPAVKEKIGFANGVRFGMSQAEVIAIEGEPHEIDDEDLKGLITVLELDEDGTDIDLTILDLDADYLK